MTPRWWPLLLAVTLAGCSNVPATGDEPGEVSNSEGPQMELPGPEVEEVHGALDLSPSTPAYSFSGADVLRVDNVSEVRVSNVTGWVVEVSWDSTLATNDVLSLWGRAYIPVTGTPADDPEPQFYTEGHSPLRLEIPIDGAIAEHFSVFVRGPRSGGVGLQQHFVGQVATFQGIAFDPEFQFPKP